MAEHHDRYIPARTNDGWGIAGLVVGLAIACIVVVTIIHKKTYTHPTDVTAGANATAPAKGSGH
jgi:hypothetical protein